MYVCSQTQIAFYTPKSLGRKLSKEDICDIFKDNAETIIQEINARGYCCIVSSRNIPSSIFKNKRKEKGLSVKEVSLLSGIDDITINNIETEGKLNSINDLDILARFYDSKGYPEIIFD